MPYLLCTMSQARDQQPIQQLLHAGPLQSANPAVQVLPAFHINELTRLHVISVNSITRSAHAYACHSLALVQLEQIVCCELMDKSNMLALHLTVV